MLREKYTWQQCRFRFNSPEGVHDAKWTSRALSSFALEGYPGARLAKDWVLALERRFVPLRGVPKMFLNDATLCPNHCKSVSRETSGKFGVAQIESSLIQNSCPMWAY